MHRSVFMQPSGIAIHKFTTAQRAHMEAVAVHQEHGLTVRRTSYHFTRHTPRQVNRELPSGINRNRAFDEVGG